MDSQSGQPQLNKEGGGERKGNKGENPVMIQIVNQKGVLTLMKMVEIF